MIHSQPMAQPKKILISAGYLSFAVAIFQAIISVSPTWSLYFGADADIVANPRHLLIVGELFAIIFALFGLYAMSGAGRIRRLPLLHTGLVLIGSTYTLRGLIIIPQLKTIVESMNTKETVSLVGPISSLISLTIGIVYLAGTIALWHELKRQKQRESENLSSAQ